MLQQQQSPTPHEMFVSCSCRMLAVTLLQVFNLGPGLGERPYLNHAVFTDGNGETVVPRRGS